MADDKVSVVMYSFENLLKESITASMKLVEYFRMKLIYYQLISGKGLEFDRIKEYVVGDDPRRIDWMKFAKTGELFFRAFKEERHYDIIFVIDVSDSMLLGTTAVTKAQYTAVATGALAYAATSADDQIAIVMVSDKVMTAVDPSADYYNVMHFVSDPNNYGGNKDWGRVVRTCLSNYHEDSIIFIISDFLDTNPDRFLPLLSSQFTKVFGIMVQDPIDMELPDKVGRMYLKDTSGKNLHLTDFDKVKKEYGLLARQHADFVKSKFHEANQLFFEIRTDEEFGTSFIKAFGEEEVIIS